MFSCRVWRLLLRIIKSAAIEATKSAAIEATKSAAIEATKSAAIEARNWALLNCFLSMSSYESSAKTQFLTLFWLHSVLQHAIFLRQKRLI